MSEHQPKAAGGRNQPPGRRAWPEAVHCPIQRAAWRCVAIIEPLLQRPEEAGEAFREFYAAIAEELSTTEGHTP